MSHRVGVGRKAFVMTAGYPARQDLLARIERVRLLELKEGVRRPVEDYGPDARASRRRGRAEMLHDAGAGDQRREDGGGSTRLGGRETEHGMGALDGEAGGGGCALGVGMQRHQRGGEVETVAPPRRGDGSEQNLASLRGDDTDARPGAGTRLRIRVDMQVVRWARVRTQTHTHTNIHTRMGCSGGCWIGPRRVGRGCGRRLAMGSGRVFARRASWGVRGLPRGSLSIYLSIDVRSLSSPMRQPVGVR